MHVMMQYLELRRAVCGRRLEGDDRGVLARVEAGDRALCVVRVSKCFEASLVTPKAKWTNADVADDGRYVFRMCTPRKRRSSFFLFRVWLPLSLPCDLGEAILVDLGSRLLTRDGRILHLHISATILVVVFVIIS